MIMKRFIFFSVFLLILNSCSVREDYKESPISLGDFLHSYDLWYVNTDATQGRERIPFLQKAFTITFNGNILLANNNLVGIGHVGSGYGLRIGNFFASGTHLTIEHYQNGLYQFRAVQVSSNEVDLYDVSTNTVYRLEGYHKRDFNYDKLFFDNIRYFLQEYEAWEKTYTSQQGNRNPFDNENFLRFYSLNGDYVFETRDFLSLPNTIFRGNYIINNTQNPDIKLLTLNYQNDIERFEIKILNDQEIELFHINSQTIYRFRGYRNIIYKKPEKEKEKRGANPPFSILYSK